MPNLTTSRSLLLHGCAQADIAPAEPKLAVEIPQQLRLHIPPLLKKVVLDDSEQVGGAGGWRGRWGE